MKKCLFIFSILLALGAMTARAQEDFVIAKNTTGEYRRQFDGALVKWSILKNLYLPLTDADNAYDFRSSFWPMELILYRTDSAKQRLEYAFDNIRRLDTGFQRALLEVIYTNYPETFHQQVARLLHKTINPKVFAMCAEYLWQNGRHPEALKAIAQTLRERFDTLQDNPILLMLKERMFEKNETQPMPDLEALFSEQFAPGLTVMYSFQRENRDQTGLTVVRRPEGHFVRSPDGTVAAIPQLARAISNLPFYLTNGNTPQGIYRMSGFDVSRSQFIGPTENIQLSLPFEIPVDSFVINYVGMDTLWRYEDYKNLLPSSWQRYRPAWHAFYAGEAGRTAIIAHGTTINSEYYKGQPYYPQTPSLGCLCTLETWSPEDGRRLSSYQQELVNAVKSAGNGIGYCVVIELDNKQEPVHLQDVLPYIRRAEKKLGVSGLQ